MKTHSLSILGALLGVGAMWVIVPNAPADDATDYANQLAQAQQERDEWQRQREQAQKEADDRQKEREQAQKDADAWQKQMDQAQKEREDWQRQMDQTQKERDDWQKQMDDAQKERDEYQKNLDAFLKRLQDDSYKASDTYPGVPYAGPNAVPRAVARPQPTPLAQVVRANQERVRRQIEQSRQQIMQSRQQLIPQQRLTQLHAAYQRVQYRQPQEEFFQPGQIPFMGSGQ